MCKWYALNIIFVQCVHVFSTNECYAIYLIGTIWEEITIDCLVNEKGLLILYVNFVCKVSAAIKNIAIILSLDNDDLRTPYTIY